MRALIGLLAAALAFASQAAPKVAVADLAYEQQVSQYFRTVDSKDNAQYGPYTGHSSSSYHEEEGNYSYVERGELRKFSGDIRGEIIERGRFQLVQARPFSGDPESQAIYDVIQRIRDGQFPGADYVLFGTVSDADFRQDTNALDNTDSYSSVLGLTLVADFSLIDTKTFQVSSAFTAMGEAQDVKLVNGRDARISHNRGRVVREVSRSLGEDVARQMEEQLGGGTTTFDVQPMQPALPPDEPARILR